MNNSNTTYQDLKLQLAEAASWLFTSLAEDLNSGRPRTNPPSGQSGIRTRDRQIPSPTRWSLGPAVSSNFSFLKLSKAASLELHSFVGWTTYASFSNQYSKWEKHFYPDRYVLYSPRTKWRCFLVGLALLRTPRIYTLMVLATTEQVFKIYKSLTESLRSSEIFPVLSTRTELRRFWSSPQKFWFKVILFSYRGTIFIVP